MLSRPCLDFFWPKKPTQKQPKITVYAGTKTFEN